eukprot:4386825-Pyramimonas_sp.AAC.1
MSDATFTRGDAPILLDSVPRKRIQEIRKDVDETLDLFPASPVKLIAGGIPVVSSAGISNDLQKFRAGLILPWEAPEQRGRARYGAQADLVSGSLLTPPLSI